MNQERTFTATDQLRQPPRTPTKQAPLAISSIEAKPVLLDFDGGQLSSDAGLLLLKEVDQQIGLTRALSKVLSDPRDPRYTKHSTEDLLRQRIFQIAAGYEDANDSDALRTDPILKMVVGGSPETGAALASQPTMTRFENRPSRGDLYRMAEVFLEEFIRLRLHLAGRESGYVFPSPRGGHYSARRLQQLVKEIAAEAGITKNVYPHLLRHTMGSDYQRNRIVR